MLRSVIAAVFLCVTSLSTYAAYGDWTIYNAYHNATKTVVFESSVYVLSDGGLYSYNPEDTHVETYNKVYPLSDNGIYDIAVVTSTHCLVIIYANSNIDIMNAKGEVYNMPDLKESALTDKTINNVYVSGSDVYISTNTGIVVLDTRRRVISNTYNFGHIVTSIIIDNGNIIAVTPDGFYAGRIGDNLLDANNWICKSTSQFQKIFNVDGTYIVIPTWLQLRYISDKEKMTVGYVDKANFTTFSLIDGLLFCFGANEVVTIDKDRNLTRYSNPGITHVCKLGNTYWAACGTEGLKGYKFDTTDGFTPTVSSVIPNSPIRNYFYKLQINDGRLLSVGGTLEFPIVQNTYTVMKYENGTWTTFEEDKLHAELGDILFRNSMAIVQDPNDSEHHFVGASAGLIEYRNYKYVKHYDHTNSPLTSILPDDRYAGFYVRTTGLNYDPQGNLWLFNNECDTIIRIIRPDGKWLAYYTQELAGHPTFDRAIFDQRGWVWINSRNSGRRNNGGIFVLDTNGTINQRSDDRQRFFYIITNQDGTTYQVNTLNCITEDLDGTIWIGCNWGTFATYNPTGVFNTDFTFTQPKVPRNDGTNYADYLLSEIEVRCIAVDGGNRKWFGTFGNGVYLTNADGSEILQHFTTDNSPLISNDIYDIAIDGSTGEVYFATTKGLASYSGDATDPLATLDDATMKVYPNPVRPEYQGPITVTGLMSDTNVKIVNAAGRLVHEGKSTGGQYTWTPRTTSGQQLASGIYYVLATDADGHKGAATKFLIVK